jgi:hypothetical protein
LNLPTAWRARLEDGPFSPAFWTGDVSAGLVGVFRAGLGAILLGDALLSFPEVLDLYGMDGLAPAVPSAGGPLAGASDSTLLTVWTIGCIALGALMVGFYSRVAALLSWAFLTVVHRANPAITTGGDYLAQILVFFCIWLDSGASHSVDARFLGRGRAFIPAAPWRGMQLHLAGLYFMTTRLKIRGGWLSGDGIYLSLQHFGFLRPLGAWLLQHPALCRLSTYGILTTEGVFALLALSPVRGRQTRLLAAACGAAVQLGVLFSMRVGSFTSIMLWTCVLFLPIDWRPAPASVPEGAVPPRRWALAGASAGLVLLMIWGVAWGRRFPLPPVVGQTLEKLGLTQPYDLFGATYEVAQWQADGVRHDGQPVDVLTVAAPGMRSQVGIRYSTFYKLTFHEQLDYGVVSRYLCAEYRDRTGVPLASVVLSKHARPPVRPGEERPFQHVVLHSAVCAR